VESTTEAAPCGDGQELVGPELLFSAEEVSPIGSVLDLATDALPMLLESVVALKQRLEFEALAGVADPLATQQVDTAIDVLAGDLRLELLDTKEVLLVQCAQPFQAHFEFFQSVVELFGLHVQPSRGRMARLSKHTGVSQSLKAKCS